MLNSQLKTSIDVSRQTCKFYGYAPVKMRCETLDIVQSMSNVCYLDHIAQTCTAVLYGSTPHLVVSRNLKLVIMAC